jgi:hypothetical protein
MLTTADIEANEGYYNAYSTKDPSRVGTAQGFRPGRQLTSAQPRRGQSAGIRPPAMPVIKQADNLDENRLVLYKRSKHLGQGYYIVEISSNSTHLFIAAFDVESPESLLIELPQRKAQLILQEFDGDYEKMASSLQVMNKKLALLNPKYLEQRNRQEQDPPAELNHEEAKDEISDIRLDKPED